MATLGSISKPIDRNRIADQIFQDIKSQILVGELARGARLPAERELAAQYGVSGPTVREAIRGLTSMGLVEVRHGSGAFVTADVSALMALSLGAVIQIDGVGAEDVLSVLAILNERAAANAANLATKEDCAALRNTLRQLDSATSPDQAAAAVLAFHQALANSAHNPLLASICRFLAELQVALAVELAGGSLSVWKRILENLKETRQQLVSSIERRDLATAVADVREFHRKALKLIIALPKAKELRVKDPQLRTITSALIRRIEAAKA